MNTNFRSISAFIERSLDPATSALTGASDEFVGLLAPAVGERILDVGCRDGAVTFFIKALGCNVSGIDTDPVKIEEARAKGLDALLMSPDSLSFDRSFEAVYSVSCLHTLRHPGQIIDNIWRVLKDGGRFAGEMPAYGHIKVVIDAFLKVLEERGVSALYLLPWYYPTVDDYSKRLKKRGFKVSNIEERKFNMAFGMDLNLWLRSFGKIFAPVVTEDEYLEFIARVEHELQGKLVQNGDSLEVECRSITFLAVKQP